MASDEEPAEEAVVVKAPEDRTEEAPWAAVEVPAAAALEAADIRRRDS